MKSYLWILFFIAIAWNLQGQETNRGKLLFEQNCSICHSSNMMDELVGPGLGGVGLRWSDYPIEDLFAYIKDAPAMIQSGHKKALEIDDASGMQFKMPAFPEMTDDDVASILDYVNSIYKITSLEDEK